MLSGFVNRKRRVIINESIAFAILPLILTPLILEYYIRQNYTDWFFGHKDTIIITNVIYIMLGRFILLDSAIYIFSHSQRHFHIALIHVVLLYLEITIITIFFYATVFYFFDPFEMFHLNSQLPPENLSAIKEHKFILSLYISAVTFTTLGSGDWIPQTIPAMASVISEVILGVVQGGVFVAILIYAHQNKEIK